MEIKVSANKLLQFYHFHSSRVAFIIILFYVILGLAAVPSETKLSKTKAQTLELKK